MRVLTRREFGRIGAGVIGAAMCQAGTRGQAVEPLVDSLVRDNDERVRIWLTKQDRRPDARWHGSLLDDYGLPSVGGTAQMLAGLVAAGASPASAFHQAPSLVTPLARAAEALLRAQHDDGTIDLLATNFHSPPDTAFVLEPVTAAATILRRQAWAPLQPVREALDTFMRRAGDALVSGGIHTPNHRWVVCAALARLHALRPDPHYVARVDQWLAETIDIDPDGQYTERSTAVYSPVVDRALLTVATLLERPALLDPVRRNLEMTLYYVHPDGEVATEASRRQDRYQRGSMARYYVSYRALALRDGNGRFAAMARQIERTARPQLGGELPAFLEWPELQQPLPAEAPLPTDYVKVFAYSKLARIRRGAMSATVLADNTTVLSLRRGQAALEAVRVASAFFGKGQFTGTALEVEGDTYHLRQHLEGPYYQPLTAAQVAGGDHVRMTANGTLASESRALRAQSNVQVLDTHVGVSERGGVVTLAIDITGTDDVPVAVELGFRHGGTLEGVEPVKGIADAFLLRAGTGRYRLGADTITFGPGRVDHTWTQLRGALPKWDGQSVYLTGLTPFHATLTLS
ncbi:hypothetical protein TBR22_A43290 [Luteitalea sp. TBR-22]|uniref:hypothetical protein n=1 Tax=Luteitalea sp. TBR-22 TaxID=2802971 RepID=UPI001AF9E15E|nr:hypothetical protein [Luteitalea sp. TBR-22]BCS35103.1 hypothetical protein TBR22_A43290 [Luteitalea sp. TBR-22]